MLRINRRVDLIIFVCFNAQISAIKSPRVTKIVVLLFVYSTQIKCISNF